jgi:hypothetical protein
VKDTSQGHRLPRIKRAPDEDGWYFDQRLRRDNGAGDVVARVADIDGCTATELQRVMRAEARAGVDTPRLLLSNTDEGYFDEEDSLVEPVSFSFVEGSLALSVSFMLKTWIDEPHERAALADVFRPLLERNRMSLHKLERDDNYLGPPWLWRADVIVSTRDRSLADLYNAGQHIIALAEALETGQLTRQTAGDLIRAGHASVLIGQPESHWLEVKRQHFDISTVSGQVALAQSVARFANAELGVLVVIGMSSKKIPGGELIKKLCPVPLDGHTIRRYQQALESRLFPPPDHLSIAPVAIGSGGVVLIDIPPQPEELKPFLVHGAFVDGRIEGSFISIVRRRGESSIPVTAPMIHSTLAAGRALLRRGQLPDEFK